MAIVIKSPREKENRIIKVKQITIAGPRSPSTRKNISAAPMANSAKEKNDQRLRQLAYSLMNFSLAAKNPARKRITRYLTISLG